MVDVVVFVFIVLMCVGRFVVMVMSYFQFYVQCVVVCQVGDNVVIVDDFNIVIQLNIGSSYNI